MKIINDDYGVGEVCVYDSFIVSSTMIESAESQYVPAIILT